MISFVWAEDINHLIGKDGQLPWKLPNDMKLFKNLTEGNSIVMGRKTFESFPNGPLPNRENIVITRDDNFSVQGVKTVNDINELNSDNDYYVIGGSQIFNLFKDKVDTLNVTRINHEFDGDTYMIDIPWNEFKLVSKIDGKIDDKNIWKHTFEKYVRQ